MSNIITKACSKCRQEKPTDDFYIVKAKNRKETFSSHCKSCDSQRAKASNQIKTDLKKPFSIPDLDGETWRQIPGVRPIYMVSNKGRTKSIDHFDFKVIAGKEVNVKGKLLSQVLDESGYKGVTLYGGKISKSRYITHVLVFFTFNPETQPKKGYEVDHIDNDKTNNNLSNLQYIKTRHNSSKRSMNLKKTSRFTGVSWDKRKNAWYSCIRISGKTKNLGFYYDEIDASIAYQKALQSLS